MTQGTKKDAEKKRSSGASTTSDGFILKKPLSDKNVWKWSQVALMGEGVQAKRVLNGHQFVNSVGITMA